MALPLLGGYWSHMPIDEQMVKIDRPLPRFFHQKTEAKNKTFEESSTFTPVTTKKCAFLMEFTERVSIY